MSIEEFNVEKDNLEDRYNCEINVERAIEVISSAIHEYKTNELGFFDGKDQVEEEYINFLKEQGESNEFILNAIFLLTIVTFGSSSEDFYRSLSKDPKEYVKHRWLLIPSEVVKSVLVEEYEEVSQDLLPGIEGGKKKKEKRNLEDGKVEFNKEWKRYIKPKGYQASSLVGWYENCKVLKDEYHGNVSEFFEKHGNDAREIWSSLVYKPGGDSKRKEFKRIDRKLASLFLQWVGRYELYDLDGMEDFGLPVDLQLCKIAIQTGIVVPKGVVYRENLANDIFAPLIVQLCKEYGWKPKDVSEALWLIGSRGCTPDLRSLTPYYTCPLKPFCKGVIHKLELNYWKFSSPENMGKKFTEWKDGHERLL